MKAFKAQSGVSVIEVLIVLAIMAIIVGFAVAQFGNAKENFKRQNIARELKVNLERARFDSVKRRPDATNVDNMSKVVIDSPTSFTTYLDFDQDGVISSDENRVIDFSFVEGVRIVGNNLNFPVTVRFDRRGHITRDASGNEVFPAFTVCDKGCTYETATGSNSSTILVSQTGTVTMTGGGEDDPVFNAPPMTSVGACEKINDWVTVGSTNSPPQSCASPTPSASATPATSPSTSPSTTPTPRACLTNERPSSANCTCLLPMTVRTNGKCI